MLKMLKYTLIIMSSLVLFIILLILSLFNYISTPKHSYISQSPNGKHLIKLYTFTSGNNEGISIHADLYDESDKIVREKIYQQWYCVNADIEWINNELISINNNELNIFTDTLYSEKKEGLYCPSENNVN